MTNSALEEATKNGNILPTTKSNCESFLSLEKMPQWAKDSIRVDSKRKLDRAER